MSRLPEFFQDDATGRYSMSRLMVFFVVVTYLILAAREAVLIGDIPDVPEGWYWLAALPYGVNKVSSAVQGLLSKPAEVKKAEGVKP